MHYIVDGYNFLFRFSGKKKQSLEQKREELIQVLSQETEKIRIWVSVVFDSAEQIVPFASCTQKTSIEVIYAPKGKSADEYILELVELVQNPKALTVVTSDNGLAKQCKHFGVHLLEIEEFIAFLLQKQSRKELGKGWQETSYQKERLLKIFEDKFKDLS